MKKFYYLFTLLFLGCQFPQNSPPNNPSVTTADKDCDSDKRYAEALFTEQQIEVIEKPFVTFNASDLWNNGETGNNTNFFSPDKYLKRLPNGQFEMSMDIYRPKNNIDPCRKRAVVLLVHGGGYAHSAAPKSGTLDRTPAKLLARLGYAVALIDYRKGWDIKNALAKQSAPPVVNLPLLPGVQNGPCEGPCDTFSFSQATYTMVQDTRAAHRYLINHANELGIDGSKVFYWGASTGAVGVVNAAFGAEEFSEYKNDNGQSMKELEGELDAFGEPYNSQLKPLGVNSFAGAIKELDWITSNDDIPMIMTHGRIDEAVKYCAGRILDMKYRNTTDLKHLMLKGGPGKMYNHIKTLNGGPNLEVHTYKGLYHSMTSNLLNPQVQKNCDERDSLAEIMLPHALWMKAILDGQQPETRHYYYANATQNTTCNIERRDDGTDCN